MSSSGKPKQTTCHGVGAVLKDLQTEMQLITSGAIGPRVEPHGTPAATPPAPTISFPREGVPTKVAEVLPLAQPEEIQFPNTHTLMPLLTTISQTTS